MTRWQRLNDLEDELVFATDWMAIKSTMRKLLKLLKEYTNDGQ